MTTPRRRRMIIDTDATNEADDQFAIVHALLSPSLEVRGVVPTIFFTVVVPLSMPALVTVFILDAVSTWNEFLLALIVLSSDVNRTVPVGLLNFQGQFSNNSTGLAAGILIAVLPILVAYCFLQKWIVGGLTAGATTG